MLRNFVPLAVVLADAARDMCVRWTAPDDPGAQVMPVSADASLHGVACLFPRLRPQRREERPDTHDVHAREIVGEHVQRHLASESPLSAIRAVQYDGHEPPSFATKRSCCHRLSAENGLPQSA
jgi:hypothetical protein